MRPDPSIALAICVFCNSLSIVFAADSQDDTEVKAYWQGNQLNNQSRLGEPFEGFEVQGTKRRPEGREADQYLQTIRKQLVDSAVSTGKEIVINFQARGFERALTISHAANGNIVVTLRLSLLFDENATGLRSGAIDVLDRLTQILSETPRRATHLVLEDELDAMPGASSVDAERSRFVIAYLTFPSASKIP